MKKLYIIIIAIIIVIFGFIVTARLLSPEDTWICQDGQWVKHGHPSALIPATECGPPITDNDKPDLIIVDTPKPNDLISSPLEIEGQARGTWYFEGSFPIELLDANGNLIAEYYATAQSDWMTEDFAPFKATLTFALPSTEQGTLILKRDNPSGLPENDEEFKIPIKFQQQETMTVKLYFGNSNLDPQVNDCNVVWPIERKIAKIEGVARAALLELLKGPTQVEKDQGYFTSINSGVKIQKLIIENNIAKVDFDKQLEFQVGGSCRVAAISSQISQTLKQFLSIKEVVISIDGRTEDILQP